MLLLPDSMGEAVLGDTWEVAEPLLVPTGVQIVFLGLMTGVRAGLLGMRAVRKVMRIDLTTTALVLVASIIGAVINGALGALWAFTFVQVLMTVVMWATFLAHTRRAAEGAGVPAEEPPAEEELPPVTVPTPPAA
jgi:O-antigen/teichoic acid export membrane protein